MRNCEFAWRWACVGLVLAAAGCGGAKEGGDAGAAGSKAAGGGGASVAVIDLDEVAKQTGQADVIKALVQAADQNLSGQLRVELANSQKELNNFKVLVGEKPNDDQQKALGNLEGELTRKLNEKFQLAQQLLGRETQGIIGKYRQALMPVALKIAQERGYGVVLVKNDTVIFTHSETVDITADVVKQLATMPPILEAPKAAAAPASTEEKTEPKAEPKADAAQEKAPAK